jgi:hypothetical protein
MSGFVCTLRSFSPSARWYEASLIRCDELISFMRCLSVLGCDVCHQCLAYIKSVVAEHIGEVLLQVLANIVLAVESLI